jgi:hypothetical protein
MKGNGMSKGIKDPLKAWGMCLIEAEKYAKKHKLGLIRATGYEYSGREHWAVYVDKGNLWECDEVIDFTARQFSLKVPAKYETDVTTWLDDVCEWLGDSVWYELYQTADMQRTPFHEDSWIRDDIDPDNYKREYAALNKLVPKK